MLKGHCDDEALDEARGQTMHTGHALSDPMSEDSICVDTPADNTRDTQRPPAQTSSDSDIRLSGDNSSDLDEYDVVSHDDLSNSSVSFSSLAQHRPRIEPQNQSSTREVEAPYHFPGTWTKAQVDTSAALKEVVSASKAFGSAIKMSGIGKASQSVGSALTVTANRGAAMAAGAAFTASGADYRMLPGALQRWLGADALEAAKRKKREAERARALQKAKQELIASGEVIETMSNRGTTSVASSPSLNRLDYFQEATVTPKVNDRQDSEAGESRRSSLYAGQSPNPSHADNLFGTGQTSAAFYQHVSVAKGSPYAGAQDRAYFDGPAASSGWLSRRQSVASGLGASHSAVPRTPREEKHMVEDVKDVELEDKVEEENEDEGDDNDFGDFNGLFGEQ